MRTILFTGKGGVGKTSASAATALLASERGYKTVVMSTDAAHSLSDSFDLEIGGKPVKLAPRLYGQEIDVQREMQENWGVVQEFLTSFMAYQGLDDVVADELAVYPGMDELFSLMQIKKYRDSGEYDLCIVDCAPTGASLRLLSYPDIMQWYLKNVFPVQRAAAKIGRPVARRLTSMPLPSDEVFQGMKDLFEKIGEMKAILTDVTKASIRLVLNPEKMVIKETQRAYTYLNLFGFSVDAIIANRIYPEEIGDVYFDKWKEIQNLHMQTVRECFSPIPIFEVKLFDREIIGLDLLGEMARGIYRDEDPAKIFYSEKPVEVVKQGGEYIISLHLPFVEKRDVALLQRGDDLTVRVGDYRRNIILPRAVQGRESKEAIFEGNKLLIKFGGEKHGRKRGERGNS